MTSRIFLQDSNDVGFKAFAAATLADAQDLKCSLQA